MRLTNKLINQIDNLIDELALPMIEIGLAATDNDDMPERWANDDILVEYYNGIKRGKLSSQMREICLPKYIRRELSNIT